jgi:hypothetical protein
MVDELFAQEARADLTARSFNEPAYRFLNRSADPYIADIRQLIADWLSHVPEGHRIDLRRRLQGKNDDEFESAFWELYLHEAYRCSGYCVGDSLPVGCYGLSQGGGVGMHLVAAKPRITAAVLGLAESDVLISIAPRITIPVEFVMQWDDAGHPRDSMLTLFDALGSTEKTLHANLGSHFEVPDFEIDSSIRFFARRLGSQGAAI